MGPPLTPGRISAHGWTLEYFGNFKSLRLSLFPLSCPSMQEKAKITCQALHKMIYRRGGQEELEADFIRDAKRCAVTIPRGIGKEALGVEFLQEKDWPCCAPSLGYSAPRSPPVADAASVLSPSSVVQYHLSAPGLHEASQCLFLVLQNKRQVLRASRDPRVHIGITSIRQEQLNMKIGSVSWNRSGWKRLLRSSSPTIKSISNPGRPIAEDNLHGAATSYFLLSLSLLNTPK